MFFFYIFTEDTFVEKITILFIRLYYEMYVQQILKIAQYFLVYCDSPWRKLSMKSIIT